MGEVRLRLGLCQGLLLRDEGLRGPLSAALGGRKQGSEVFLSTEPEGRGQFARGARLVRLAPIGRRSLHGGAQSVGLHGGGGLSRRLWVGAASTGTRLLEPPPASLAADAKVGKEDVMGGLGHL